MIETSTKRVALVTGAGAGIGRDIARSLLGAGYNVAFADIDPKKARDAVSEAGDGIAVAVDIRDSAQTADAVAATVSRFGKLDLLVNNAGIVRQQLVAEMTDDNWRDTIDVNLTGTFFMCRAALPHIVAQRGKIINIASWVAKAGRAFHAAYSASKFGVIGLTQTLALELAGEGVTVNAVLPGAIGGTEMMERTEVWARSQGWPDLEQRAKAIPLGRVGAPSDISGAVLFLASESADFITGHSLVVSGGTLMA